MQLDLILRKLQNCPCGRTHTADVRTVAIGENVLAQTARILRANAFPTSLLVVADRNTLSAADGILDVLHAGGFSVHTMLYDDLRTADQRGVDDVLDELSGADAVLSVGTGSLNDICRRAAFLADKPFAIFATAPSMDGFASDTAPITNRNFKTSLPARQPAVILADTRILAAAPAELKAAGYGDMLAKYIALADWRIARLVIGEYYCPQVAAVTRDALRRMVALTDRVQTDDPSAAGAIMEALVLTGLAMKLCGSSRAASGAEHVVSHFWECKKLEMGQLSDFHGKKVGVATRMIARLYYDLLQNADPAKFGADQTDWARVYEVYGDAFADDVRRLNTPTVTDETTPEILREGWPEIRSIVYEEIPQPDALDDLLRRAGGARTFGDIAVSEELGLLGLEFHPYMRHRMLLSRLIPMLGCAVDYRAAAGLREPALL